VLLSPARNKKTLIHLEPKENRCTVQQRRCLAGLTAKDAKLSDFDFQAMTRVLFPSFGTERITTYHKLASELQCGVTALEKPIRRLKEKGWIEVEKDAGGEGGRETVFRPAWDRAEALYRKFRRTQPRTTRKRQKSRASKTSESSATSPPKPSTEIKPIWDSTTGELRFGDHVHKFARQAHRLRDALNAFQAKGWPEKIDTVCEPNSQPHKDLLTGLNKCKFLYFGSKHSGTMIAWKKSDEEMRDGK
jgi:hypothetical protein